MTNVNVPTLPTWVSELTPRGRGAVAVVLVSGPAATTAVAACFVSASGRRLAEIVFNHIAFGRWGGPEGEEVIVCRRSDDAVEVHCHGGTAAVAAVIEQLRERGCEMVPWRQVIGTVEPDPIRAAARIALAEAPTARTAAVLVEQFNGALARVVDQVLTAIAADDWRPAIDAIDSVLAHQDVGLHLVEPWRVVLAGRPNVGKSSLMNALVGFERAIVFDQPGTTRDVVTMRTGVDGWPVELADTAGLRRSEDEVELAGVALAAAALADADLAVLVDDAGRPERGDGSVDHVPAGTPVVRVLNKIDLSGGEWQHAPLVLPSKREESARGEYDVYTSALTGHGIGDLVNAIGRALVPTPPPAWAAVPFTAEQVRRFVDARTAAQQRAVKAVVELLRPLTGGCA